VEVDVLRPQSLSPEMAARWRELQRRERAWDTPFLSPEWARAVERTQGDEDRGLRVLVLHEGGRADGFMAVRAGAYTAMPAGAPMCDYQGLVAEAGVCADPRQLLKALGVRRFDFGQMLAGDPTFAAYGRGEAVSWVVDLPDGYDAYAQERRAAGVGALKDLDKKHRKVEREAGAIRFTARSSSKADFERMIELKRDQYRATSQTDVFGAGWPLELLQGLFGADEAGFGGLFFTLHIGERLAAAQFHLAGEKTIHAWMIAHECEFERYSPGLLLFQSILRWMDETPYDRFDLGHGDYRFKRELANTQITVAHGFVGLPSTATLVREAAYGVRRAAEALPLGKVSELPGKAMRRLDLLRGLR
jgi:CelD/BcsL family acetyltransferase involved in cellulose biosynthesis